MGEHDQTVLHDEDAHQSIHDDGRTLRQGGLVYNPGYPVAVPGPGPKKVPYSSHNEYPHINITLRTAKRSR
jgi:hypothetical protein